MEKIKIIEFLKKKERKKKKKKTALENQQSSEPYPLGSMGGAGSLVDPQALGMVPILQVGISLLRATARYGDGDGAGTEGRGPATFYSEHPGRGTTVGAGKSSPLHGPLPDRRIGFQLSINVTLSMH